MLMDTGLFDPRTRIRPRTTEHKFLKEFSTHFTLEINTAETAGGVVRANENVQSLQR